MVDLCSKVMLSLIKRFLEKLRNISNLNQIQHLMLRWLNENQKCKLVELLNLNQNV
jgi:hypothetical protein